jgi:hypothetical protein
VQRRFSPQRWVHGASLTLEKNPNYWDKDNVPLQKIEIPHITNDNNTLLNYFNPAILLLLNSAATPCHSPWNNACICNLLTKACCITWSLTFASNACCTMHIYAKPSA